jgi:TPR repeat protein
MSIERGLLIALTVAFAAPGCDRKEPQQTQEVIPKGDAGRRMYFEKRCEAGHAGMCGELALMWSKGWGGAKDRGKADALYRRACDEGVPAACEEVGIDLDIERQIEILQSNCDKGVAFACNNLGHLLWLGQGVEADPVRARKVLERACEGGFSASCRAMAKLCGEGLGGDRDDEAAREWNRKAREAYRVEEAMELKYLHAKPMSQRHVGEARPALIEARKRKAREEAELNEQILKDKLKTVGNEPEKPRP